MVDFASPRPVYLGTNDYLPLHPKIFMQRTDIREGPCVRERDAEACHAQGGLGESKTFLWGRDDEPRVGAIGNRIDDRVPSPVLIDCYVG